MENRWRNLLVIVVLALAVYAIYTYFTAVPRINESFQKTLSANGIDVQAFDEAVDSFALTLESGNLDSAIADWKNFGSQNNISEDSANYNEYNYYLQLLEFEKKQDEIMDRTDELFENTNVIDACENFENFVVLAGDVDDMAYESFDLEEEGKNIEGKIATLSSELVDEEAANFNAVFELAAYHCLAFVETLEEQMEEFEAVEGA